MDETAFRRSWLRALGTLGAHDPDEELFHRLLACYREPQRVYHTLEHLGECLTQLEPVLPMAQQPGEVEAALWFHDAVYALDRHDNELRSALWARQTLLAAGAAQAPADRVHGLVMATQHATAPVAPDAQLLVDVDLAILGASAERFDVYERQVRQEYAQVPEAAFRTRRRTLLSAFLARPRLYHTAYFFSLLEEAARENLRRSVARLAD